MNINASKRPDDVAVLARELIAEARERAEAEQRLFSRLGTVSRLVLILAVAATIAAGVTTIYGMGWLPADIPIRQSGSGFVSKRGDPHTREMFDRYQTWSTAMFVTYPASIALWFLFAGARKLDAS